MRLSVTPHRISQHKNRGRNGTVGAFLGESKIILCEKPWPLRKIANKSVLGDVVNIVLKKRVVEGVGVHQGADHC